MQSISYSILHFFCITLKGGKLQFPKQAKPDLIRIFRHLRAIPQYEITSGERFATIERLQRRYSGLTIAGNLRDGIGMAHRIKQAVETADKCLEFKV